MIILGIYRPIKIPKQNWMRMVLNEETSFKISNISKGKDNAKLASKKHKKIKLNLGQYTYPLILM